MPEHILATLKSPLNVYIKILGETHFKSNNDEIICNYHINDNKIKYILVEQPIPNFLTKHIYLYFNFLMEKFFQLFSMKNSSINTTIQKNINCYQNKKQIHSLEGNKTSNFSDLIKINISLLCVCLSFLLYPFHTKISNIFVILNLSICVIDIIILQILKLFTYKFRSKFSEITYFQTELYRRDKIMAESIISFTKSLSSKSQNENFSEIIAIFGSSHYEGIIYYLNLHGFSSIDTLEF